MDPSSGFTVLTWASIYNHLDVVEIVLKNPNLDINKVDRNSRTAVFLACSNGNTQIVKALLDHKNVKGEFDIDINKNQNANDKYETPLYTAISAGHTEIVKELLKQKSIKIDHDILLITLGKWIFGGKCYPEIFQELLKIKELDINEVDSNIGGTPLYWACSCSCSHQGSIDIIRMLLSDEHIDVNKARKDGRTPLLLACMANKKPEVVRELLKHKDIMKDFDKKDSEGYSPSFYVCNDTGDTNILREFLQCKSISLDVNLVDTSHNSGPWTMLSSACCRGDLDTAKELIMRGAIINDKCFEWRGGVSEEKRQEIWNYLHETRNLLNLKKRFPENSKKGKLLLACSCNNLDEVKNLINEKDIDPNEVDEYGRTALFMACEKRCTHIVQELLKIKNIDVNKKDNQGSSPMYLALTNQDDNLVLLLEKHGAKIDEKCEKYFQDFTNKLNSISQQLKEEERRQFSEVRKKLKDAL